jgi:PAS domain S-box-containing protein
MLVAARDAGHLQLLQEVGLQSAMIVPLAVGGRTLGAMTLVPAASGRHLTSADLALAEDLAGRCALAVDNARLYRQAQEANRTKEESLALLDTLLASAPVGLAFFDRELRYVCVNQALAAINGLPPEAHLGRTPHEITPQLTPVLEPLHRYVLATGKPVVNAEVSGETHAAPGERRHWLVSYYPVRTPAGDLRGIGTVTADITERKQAEEALRQARDELDQRVQERTAELLHASDILRQEIAEHQQAEEQLHRQQEALYQSEKLAAMGELLASVAHELNNPLSVVMMQADLLREDLREGALAEQAQTITQSAERCVHIVHNFLTLARQHPPERRPVDLNKVVEAAVELLVYALRVDNIYFDLKLAPALPLLGADPHQLHQVVNLVTNAHQALREVPPPRRLTLTIHTDPAGTPAMLEVDDTGPGIPAELQTRIFEPFFTTKPPGVGTGLGLSLCRGIIEGHGGTMHVQSQPGRGTVFRVELPIEGLSETGSERPGAESSPPVRAQAQTILVIDDEPGITSALAYLLRRGGYVVDTAANGRLALEKLQAQAYDLILCDLRMPELV